MNHALNNKIQAEAIVQTLVERGLSGSVLSPGSRNTPLVLALDGQRESIIVETILDERTAGFYALGLARASGRPVALCCTSGTAAAHYLPAVIEASQSNIPLVLLTADRPEELHGTGAPQTVPQQDLFTPFVRHVAQLTIEDLGPNGDEAARAACEAINQALGDNPGPVHLNIPFPEPLWQKGLEPAQNNTFSQTPNWEKPKKNLQSRDVGRALELLTVSSKGVFVCGHRERLPGEEEGAFVEGLTALAEKLSWPIVAEPGSGLRYGTHDRSKVIDLGDLLLRSEDFATSTRPDCIVQVGRSTLSKPTLRWMDQLQWDKKLIIPTPGKYSSAFYRSGIVLESDPVSILNALNESVTLRSDKEWSDSWLQRERLVSSAIETGFDSNQLWEGQVARILVEQLPERTKLFVGNSMPGRDLHSYGGGRAQDLTFWANRGANGIDGNIATLLGSARFAPTTAHVGLIGDLAALHDIGSLITQTAHAPNVTIIIIDNGGGNIFSHLPISQHTEAFERRFLTPPSVDLNQVLKGLPISYQSVETPDDLSHAIQEELEREAFSLLRIKVDREFSLSMHDKAVKASIEALGNEEARR